MLLLTKVNNYSSKIGSPSYFSRTSSLGRGRVTPTNHRTSLFSQLSLRERNSTSFESLYRVLLISTESKYRTVVSAGAHIQTVFQCLAMFKVPMQCFSMQVVMNKCFLLNPEKNLVQLCLVVFEKKQKPCNFGALHFRKKSSTIRRLGYSYNQLNC